MARKSIKGDILISVNERRITTRQAKIVRDSADHWTWSIHVNGVNVSFHGGHPWPPRPEDLQQMTDPLARLREHIEICHFGGRVELGWRRVGTDCWQTDVLLSDESGNGFAQDEIEMIRSSMGKVVA